MGDAAHDRVGPRRLAPRPANPPAPELSPEPTAQVLASRLRLVMIRLSRQLRRQDPSELTIAQHSALATVVHCGLLGVGQLAEAELLPSPAATRLADRLEEAGLVSRQVNPQDRRGVLLVATPKGREVVSRRERAGNAWLASRLASLTGSDHLAIERMVGVLEAMVADKENDKGTR